MTTTDLHRMPQDTGATASLHAQWARVGGGFTVRAATHRVDIEQLIVHSAHDAHADPRLFWVMGAWIAIHYKLIDMRRLGRLLDAITDEVASATAGAGIAVAAVVADAPKPLTALQHHCRRLTRPRPLFDVVARTPALLAIAQAESRPEFHAWGFWQHDITDKRDAIRPVAWILAHCPEFRYRSVFGADLEAGILEAIAEAPATVSDLARATGASRPAVHEAIENLVARGLALKPSHGYRREVHMPANVGAWLSDFPHQGRP